MAMHGIVRRPAATAAAIGMGALLLGGCGTNDLPNTQVFAANGTAPASMTVACEPTQRAIVRQVVVNGMMTPQVECTSTPDAYGRPAALVPVNERVNDAVPVSYQRAAYVADTPARLRPVTYQRARSRVVRSDRSWQKSALIIGSSTGIGAGVGAAVGGKKGALIGAALGGGGATIWDQLTRRR